MDRRLWIAVAVAFAIGFGVRWLLEDRYVYSRYEGTVYRASKADGVKEVATSSGWSRTD